MEAVAAEFGLMLEWGNSVHLLDGDGKGIASVHTTGLENDVTVNPKYERARELFRSLTEGLFGASAEGPCEWR